MNRENKFFDILSKSCKDPKFNDFLSRFRNSTFIKNKPEDIAKHLTSLQDSINKETTVELNKLNLEFDGFFWDIHRFTSIIEDRFVLLDVYKSDKKILTFTLEDFPDLKEKVSEMKLFYEFLSYSHLFINNDPFDNL